MEIKDVLVINPGSTSTKIAIFTEGGSKLLFETNIVHDEGKVLSFPDVASQKDYRKETVLEYLRKQDYDLSRLSAVVGRGGMIIGLKSGGYAINERLYEKMASPELPQHASSLGALVAYPIAQELGIPSFIYDSTMGCDLLDTVKITGIAEIEKYGATHLLNSRAQAMKYAASVGRDYKEMQIIVCHMGGGITANDRNDPAGFLFSCSTSSVSTESILRPIWKN